MYCSQQCFLFFSCFHFTRCLSIALITIVIALSHLADASPSSDVEAVQHGFTSIIVTWTASSDATGYRIYYTSDSDSGSEEGSTSDSSLTLSELKNGETYSISIVATSPDMATNSPITREVHYVVCVCEREGEREKE